MKKLSLIIGIVLGLASCRGKVSVSYPEPDHLLEEEQMIGIITELSIIEAVYQMKYIQISRYSTLLQQDADSIFRIFGTDKNVFEESMTYYSHHQLEMVEIYQSVKLNLEKRQSELPEETEESISQDNESEMPERTIREIRDTDTFTRRVGTEEDM